MKSTLAHGRLRMTSMQSPLAMLLRETFCRFVNVIVCSPFSGPGFFPNRREQRERRALRRSVTPDGFTGETANTGRPQGGMERAAPLTGRRARSRSRHQVQGKHGAGDRQQARIGGINGVACRLTGMSSLAVFWAEHPR